MNFDRIADAAQVRAGDLSAAGASAEKAVGEWNGLEVVVVDDPMSLLADAAEELTFSASETVEKDLADRKKPEKRDRVATVVPPAEALAEMQQHMAERLAKLLAAVKKAMGNPAAFRQAVEAFSGDATERHAALLWLEERLADQPSLAELAARTREQFEQENAAAIQAGYNVAGVDAGPIGSSADGRDMYRRTILGHDDIASVLEEVLSRVDEDTFLDTVDFLRRAVSADLSAARPSADKRDLEAMNNDLFHLRALCNFTREFADEVGKLREGGGKPPLAHAGIESLRLLLGAKNERLVMVDGLRGILGLEGKGDPTYDVRALTATHGLVHKLPLKLFRDDESRARLLTAVQTLLDKAIDLEEEVLGE